MQFDTKLAVVLRDDLEVWQKTNVTAFLVSGIAGTVPGVVGEPYRDASRNSTSSESPSERSERRSTRSSTVCGFTLSRDDSVGPVRVGA